MKFFTQKTTLSQVLIPAIGALLLNSTVAFAEDLQPIEEGNLQTPASLLEGTEERNLSEDYWRLQAPPEVDLGVGGPLEPFQYDSDFLNNRFPPIQVNPPQNSFQKNEEQLEWPLTTW